MNPFRFPAGSSPYWDGDRAWDKWLPFPRHRKWKWPTDYRSLMGWIFAATILGNFVNIARAAFHPRSLTLLQNVLLGPIYNFAMVAICGIALWAIWQNKSWARGWAVASSSTYLLRFLSQFLLPLQAVWSHYLDFLIVAVLGMAAFSSPDQDEDRSRGMPPNPPPKSPRF